MSWRDIFEKSGYYVSESESHKIRMLQIFIFVSILAILLDLWLIHLHLYEDIKGINGLVILILGMTYVLFPRFLSLDNAILLAIGATTFFILFSLNISGFNTSFVLFSLAIIPIYTFFFQGPYIGLLWSLMVILFLFMSIINSLFGWTNIAFDANTLAQITIAYIALTYLYYNIELKRVEYEQSLSDLVEKRTMLLKELHHRSKNNLQTVMGLLESQAMRVEDENCRKVLTSQRLRLKTMSMIHESLSGSLNYERIEMSDYFEAISRHLGSVFGHEVISDFDSIYLPMDDAKNIGLFFNEALSNAAEHAYPDGDRGTIRVSLKGTSREFEVLIRDYGKGYNSDEKRTSLGLVLMEDICYFFKDSMLSINVDNGTEVRAHFSMV